VERNERLIVRNLDLKRHERERQIFVLLCQNTVTSLPYDRSLHNKPFQNKQKKQKTKHKQIITKQGKRKKKMDVRKVMIMCLSFELFCLIDAEKNTSFCSLNRTISSAPFFFCEWKIVC